MNRILFPTDFSVAANTAFVYALHFADSFNAELVILHVYDLPIVETAPLAESTKEIFDIVEMNQFESFREQLPELHQIAEQNHLCHVRMRNVLLYGDLIYTINKVCKDEMIDMIVMGTKGASGLKETFLGSTTASVMTNSHVPVLAIPTEAKYKKIKDIAFTTQFKDKDNEALTQALEIGDKFNARVHGIYIRGTEDAKELDARIRDWMNHYGDTRISFIALAGEDKEQTLLDFIENRDISLLIMRTHKRGFFEGLFHRSFTKKMTYHTKVPILIFHDN
jgi:nucleotide-binding universal stress UspA family protein